MKRFEHEVLTFSVDKAKNFEAMQKQLREWGDAGYEIISVVPGDMHSRQLTVFLKREVMSSPTMNNEAA